MYALWILSKDNNEQQESPATFKVLMDPKDFDPWNHT